MKSNRKTKIILILGISFAFSPIITINLSYITDISNRISDYCDDSNLDNKNLKISAVSGKIHIINNSGWIAFRNAGNCTGSGNYTHPYIIKDLVIDGEDSGSCILIENSDVYFKIENCTLFNSDTSGLYLKNVSNGEILNNNCSFNKN